ncbi:hypothetical protein HGRIS_010667 [Hohenbuehelia grisea]|uniref:Peptidase C14 caspase domain-containing protein n=1 Tax=Hohenbuehelia grisea TaxID=104357 RepID=A0ABR3IXH3_9AGAR
MAPSNVSSKRKALLVGIAHVNGTQSLRGPGRDVLGMKSLLIKQFGYQAADIVVLLDTWKNKSSHVMPTKENILVAIDNLVRDCQPGDQFVFHYSGHTDQQVNKDGTEEDGFDECIMTQTGYILDDELKLRLVDPLCGGAQLVAILDTCHSETLLDLPHYHCNFVPIPTPESKETKVRQWCKPGFNMKRLSSSLSPASASSSKKKSLSLDMNVPKVWAIESPIRQIMSSPIDAQTPIAVALTRSDSGSSGASSQSHSLCRGVCVPSDPGKLPRVVTISACKDSQFSWEDETGSCMTQVLIEVLKKHPNPNLRFVMEEISRIIRKNAERRVQSPGWKPFFRKAKKATGKVNKFQHPSLSGLMRLDLDQKLGL